MFSAVVLNVVELSAVSHTDSTDEILVTALPTIRATTGNVPACRNAYMLHAGMHNIIHAGMYICYMHNRVGKIMCNSHE